MARMQQYRQKVELFFREADLDKSGYLNWEEFHRHMQNEHVKAYFEALELDVQQAHVLFEILDSDGSDEVSFEEFLEGCYRLKGQARSIDVNMLVLYSKKLCDQI